VVSYVINGGPRPVAAPTRARVEAAIEALGYRPNALAGAFRRGRTKTIGVLIPSPLNPFYAELAQVIENELLLHGYLMSMGISTFNAEQDSLYLQSFSDRRMDGVIVAANASLPRTRTGAADIPQVILDDASPQPSAAVFTDNHADALRAVDHLQGHGHRIIGCIACPPTWTSGNRRVRAWRDQQRRAGLPSDEGLVAYADSSETGGASALRTLLSADSYRHSRHPVRPTAIFVSTDVQAFGVLRACSELGVRVPDDLAVVSFDGTHRARYTQPRLTTMRQPLHEIVTTAVSMLLNRIADHHDDMSSVDHLALKGNLVIGETCGCGSMTADG